MPPKPSKAKHPPPPTSPPAKKRTKTAHPSPATTSQSTLNSFFKSPVASGSKTGTAGSKDDKTKGKGKVAREDSNGVIDLDSSDVEEGDGSRSDEHLAQKLAGEEGWILDGSGRLSGSQGSTTSSLVPNGLLEPASTTTNGKTNGQAQAIGQDVEMLELSSDSEPEAGPSKPAAVPPSKPQQPLASIFTRKRKSSASPPPPERKPPTNFSGTFSTPTKMLSLQTPSHLTSPQAGFVVKPEPFISSEVDIKPSTSATASSSGPPPSADDLDFDTDTLMFRLEEVPVAHWPGGRLPYDVLVRVYVQVGGTRSRLAIGRMLTNFLRLLIHSSPQDLLPTIYLLSNHLSPSYIPFELGVGSQILNKAIKEVSGVGPDVLRKLWSKWGDAGDVAFEAKSSLRTLVRPAPLLAHQVYTQLHKIAKCKGTGAAKQKGEIVRRLLVQAKGEEVRYLVRTLSLHLRIGAVRLTLLSALARAFTLTRPPTCINTDLATSVHASPEELAGVKPIPVKGKGKGKAKEEPDETREAIEEKLLEGIAVLRRVYARHPNYGDIVKGLMEGGLENLAERVPLSVGIPLSPMLGSITRSLNEVFTRLGSLPFTSEAKLDGQRVQIHARTQGPSGENDGGGRWVESKIRGKKVWVRLFSRHLEDMSEKYPDVNALVACLVERALPATRTPFPDRSNLSRPNKAMLDLLQVDEVTSFVIDAEIVAVDKDTGAYRTFQDLSNRAKKDVKVEDIKVIVGVFAFDLMLLNDVPLLEQPFSIRRHLLRTILQPFYDKQDLTIARFAHIESIDSTKPEDVQAFFEHAVAQKCEGLMVKLLESGEGIAGEDDEDDAAVVEGKGKKGQTGGGKKKALPSTYEPDARSQGWLKVKKDYLEGMGDSLDLVPIGAWSGMGRKAGWWSPILLALYNPDTGALESVCKCISGFTDQFYKDLLERYPREGKPEDASTDGPLVYCETGGLDPEIWFAPNEVWEIRGADITMSPVYPASATHLGSERGLSLRFPRFIRVREDKGWEDATTSAQFADMYRKQMQDAPPRTALEGDPVEADGAGEEELDDA